MVLMEGQFLFQKSIEKIIEEFNANTLDAETIRLTVNGLFTDCEELLFDSPYKGSILITDSSLFQLDGSLQGDEQRQRAIDRITSMYCYKVISTLFKCT